MDPWAPANVTYEDYVAMCGCPPVLGLEGMLAHYNLSMAQWSAVAAHWNGIIATNPQYVQHSMRVEQEAGRIRAGGAPRPVAASAAGAAAAEPPINAVSGAMPGAVPPPGYGPSPAASTAFAPPGGPGYSQQPPGYSQPQPGYAPQPVYPQPPAYPQPPGYAQQPPQPAYPPQPGYAPQPGYPPQQPYPQQQPGYSPQAAAFGNSVGNAFNAFGDALGSVVNSVVGTLSPGQAVMVQWSDGQRYPASVIIAQGGQVQVAFPDGRRVWVPQHFVVLR